MADLEICTYIFQDAYCMRITLQLIHELSVWLEYVEILMNHPDFPFQVVETDAEQDSEGN